MAHGRFVPRRRPVSIHERYREALRHSTSRECDDALTRAYEAEIDRRIDERKERASLSKDEEW